MCVCVCVCSFFSPFLSPIHIYVCVCVCASIYKHTWIHICTQTYFSI